MFKTKLDNLFMMDSILHSRTHRLIQIPTTISQVGVRSWIGNLVVVSNMVTYRLCMRMQKHLR